MEFVELDSSRLPGLSPLAFNAASSILGFVSLFIFYKALVAQKLVGLSEHALQWCDHQC